MRTEEEIQERIKELEKEGHWSVVDFAIISILKWVLNNDQKPTS